METISTTAAGPDAMQVCSAGSRLGLPLTKEFYASYQRSPLAQEAEGTTASAIQRTPLAAAATAAAGAVASKTVAEASAAAAGAASSLHPPRSSVDAPAPQLPRGDDSTVDRIMRGNGLSLASFAAEDSSCSLCRTAHSTLPTPLPGDSGWRHSTMISVLDTMPLWPLTLQGFWEAAEGGGALGDMGERGAPSKPLQSEAMPSIGAVAAGSATQPRDPASRHAPQREVILSLEMFERDVQHVVDEYCAGAISPRDLVVVRFFVSLRS